MRLADFEEARSLLPIEWLLGKQNQGLLIELGWSSNPVDYCWLDCEGPGYLRVWGQFQVVLCKNHAREMESSAHPGYPSCRPPTNSKATFWPWIDTTKTEIEA